MPVYLSVVAPLAGTETFWTELRSRELAPNLRLRDLEGETIAYAKLADRPEALVAFVEQMFRRPWTVVDRTGIVIKTLRRVARSGCLNPLRWLFMSRADLHCFVWSKSMPTKPRTYLAGKDALDPQYRERPGDLSETDRKRYFDPIVLTDAAGEPADWLKSVPAFAGSPKASEQRCA